MPKISMSKCKKNLSTLWFLSAGILFFILIMQSILGHYGEQYREAWEWLLPNIIPTLSLIISVLVMDALGKSVKTESIDSYMFKFTFSLSLIYLLTILITILLQPFSTISPIELMKRSILWLGPFQGLVSASIVAFFVKAE